jgi:hypothetical protein
MIIRRQQMDEFVRVEQEKFEQRTLESLKQNWPDQYKARGEEEARKSIRAGVERAEKHGLTLEGHVTTYIDLMWAYGDDFDQDPQCGWAQQILRNPELEAQEKVDRLVAHVRQEGQGA